MALGVIFDMDGVLVDSAPAHLESWQRLAAHHGLEVTAERFRESFGRPSRDIIRLLWGPGTSDRQIAQLDAEKEQIYRELIRAQVPLMPGCRATLRTLHESGFKLAVATSGPPENVEVVLSEGLIANYFAARVDGFEIFRGKPAPDCFRLADALFLASHQQSSSLLALLIEDHGIDVCGSAIAAQCVVGRPCTQIAFRPLSQAKRHPLEARAVFAAAAVDRD